MKTDGYSNNRFASSLAAAAVTTVLVSSLVGAFQPEQLLRFSDPSAAAQIATIDARKGDEPAHGA